MLGQDMHRHTSKSSTCAPFQMASGACAEPRGSGGEKFLIRPPAETPCQELPLHGLNHTEMAGKSLQESLQVNYIFPDWNGHVSSQCVVMQ